MAIKINGTNVINDAEKFVNIKDVPANYIATDSDVRGFAYIDANDSDLLMDVYNNFIALNYVAISPSGTDVTWDPSKSINFTVRMDGNYTMKNPTRTLSPFEGKTGTFELWQDSTGSRTMSWESDWKFTSGSAPTLSNSPGVTDLFAYTIVDSDIIVFSEYSFGIPKPLPSPPSPELIVSFRGHILGRENNIDNPTGTTILRLDSSAGPGGTSVVNNKDFIILTGFWDTTTPTTITASVGGTAATEIIENYSSGEYPEGASFYFKSDSNYSISSGSTKITATSDYTNYPTGVALIFNTNGADYTISVGNTVEADGPSALNTTLNAEAVTTVPANTYRIKTYFGTGRPINVRLQDLDVTYPSGDWTTNSFDGDGANGGKDDMNYSYIILGPGDIDSDFTFTTNDAGRQAHHIMSIDLTKA